MTFQFIDGITVSRKGKRAADFVREWTPQEATLKLQKRQNPNVPPHTFVEFLSCPDGDRTLASPGKLYLDRDIYIGTDPPTAEVTSTHLQEVQANVQVLVDRFKNTTNPLTFKIATRHGYCPKRHEHKLSFRPFIQGLTIKYTDIPRVIKFMGQELFWDMSVYKPTEQLLASINGCKGRIGGVEDLRVLTPEKETDDPLLYVVQHVEPEWILVNLKPECSCSADPDSDDLDDLDDLEPLAIRTHSAATVLNVSNTLYVRDVMACLSDVTSSNRLFWLDVAYALNTIDNCGDEFFADFLVFSRKSLKFESDRDCRKTWDSCKVGNNGSCRLGTLIFHAKRDNPTAYAAAIQAWKERQQLPPYAFVEDFTGPDFHELLRAALINLHPAFQGLTREGFLSIPIGSDNGVLLQHPTLLEEVVWSLPTNIAIGGTVIGDIAPGLHISHICLHLAQVRKTEHFQVFCVADGPKLDMTMTGVEEPRSLLELYDVNGTPTGWVDLHGHPSRAMTTKEARAVVGSVKAQIYSHVDMSLGNASGTTKLYFNITLNQTFTTNITVVGNASQVNSAEDAPKKSPFADITIKLQEVAEAGRLRKKDGWVYEPIPECPCAFVAMCRFHKYINMVLGNLDSFTHYARAFKDAMAYLEERESDRMPLLEPDLNLLSFRNGVLQLTTAVFTEYEGMDLASPIAKRAARHHIPHDYTGQRDTPLLDVIFSAQFDADVAEVLCALCGRLLFKVGQLDKWQVMPFLVGIGGTGKSLLLNIMDHLFSGEAVGSLAAKREEVFGMANLVGKEVVFGRDMPAKMSASLPQEIMQTVTSGEKMEIPHKGVKGIMMQWTAPLILASNHMPDYVNTGNNIGRRMVCVRFDNVIRSPDYELEDGIVDSELPNIVCRFLGAYATLRARVKAVRGFWNNVPPIMLEWRGTLGAATNMLAAFLEMEDYLRGYTVRNVVGAVTLLEDLKAVFEDKMSKPHKPISFLMDTAVLLSHGYFMEVNQTGKNKGKFKREMTCKACKGKARVDCCPTGCPLMADRILKVLVHDMELMRYVAGTHDAVDFAADLDAEEA